jgi:phosphatidate cytidylyltransferase
LIRVLSGVLLAAAFLAIVWFASSTVLLVIALAVAALAFQEYAELLRNIGIQVSRLPTLVLTLFAVAMVPFPYIATEAAVAIALIVIAGIEMNRLRSRASPESGSVATIDLRNAVANIAGAVLSVVYLGLPLGMLVSTHVVGGRGAVLLLVATIAISDTAQYYSGRLLGRHALAPALSPKKTIEGAVGGFVAATIVLYFAGPYLVPVAASATIAPLGVALVAAGIAGDLFESTIKRAAQMKDSSALIPGHGGVLDRIDALLFATPIFYVYLLWVYSI